MDCKTKHVAVIGGGVSGLSAAGELAKNDIRVTIIEKAPFLGGHAITYSCKAMDACVKCGACMVEAKLQQVSRHPDVTFLSGTTVDRVSTGPDNRYTLDYEMHPPHVDEEKCDGCGQCFQACPAAGALLQGTTSHLKPYVAIREDRCRFFDDASCTRCRDVCDRSAIRLSRELQTGTIQVDAILLATGFSPYDPSSRPYGYGRFENVITNFDAEGILRRYGGMKRPSDGRAPGRIAFIQCVGSRDSALGHPWCSKICCAAALRMARMIQWRQPDTEVAFFYIDVQTFGKQFQIFYDQARSSIQMIRSIPGDIFKTVDDRLKLIYFDPRTRKSEENLFDIVVLSVGMAPLPENRMISKLFNRPLADSGFFQTDPAGMGGLQNGVFITGAAQGPMSIAESINNAGRTVWQMINYLEADGGIQKAE